MPYPISVTHISFPLCCSPPCEALNISFAASHCSLGYLGIFQLLRLGFLIGTRMPEGEKRKREDEGVSKVWVGQNTDFHSWERKELPCKQEKGEEIGRSQVRDR